MDDTDEKAASSLAIVEKKPQRPGGCVGIFFQLFDWKRRFAKKKLFSNKLLPQVRLKQASERFGGNDRQPKHRLIADENSGGFPIGKKNNGATNGDREQMRTPGLVARLMGLESMPALQKEKAKKVSGSGLGTGKLDKFVDEEQNVGKVGIKHELRPQKLQKTNVHERRSMCIFGAETLVFKNVLSKSRKHHHHHHPKLPSPVKSPRKLSRKNSSKLIGAATRILEPGLQTSKSKCALTYSNTLHHHPVEQDAVMEERTHFLSNKLEDPDDFVSVALKGKPSCRNCGHLLSEPSVFSNQPWTFASPFSHSAVSTCQGSERSNPGQNFCSSRKTQSQNRMLRARETVPQKSKLNNLTMSNRISTATVINETKKFVSVNQSLSGNGTIRQVHARTSSSKFESEKRVATRQNELVPPGRKRRPSNISRHGESSGTIEKQAYDFAHAISGKQLGCNDHFINQQCLRGGLPPPHLRERRVGSCQGGSDSVSFTFSSSVKPSTGDHEVQRRVRNVSNCKNSSKKSATSEHGRENFEKPFHLSGDALGALLDKKMKELTFQGEDLGVNAAPKSIAMILQELIPALTSEIPFQQDKWQATADRRKNSCDLSHLGNTTSSTNVQASAMAVKLPLEQSLCNEHPSSGSVLEAYFSNESYPSSSVDDCLGYKTHNEIVDNSTCGPRSPNPDPELWDSATSMNSLKSSRELVVDILNSVSETLCCSHLDNCGLKGGKLDQAKEVLLNAELALRSAALSALVLERGSPIKRLLLELGTLANVLWMNFGSSLGTEDGKEVNQLKKFALDSIIEFLDLRFERYPFKAVTALPLSINTNMLVFGIMEEVRRWEELSAFFLDDLIEEEMSRSMGEWTGFKNERFETGIEISRDVFQILVDEIVIDLGNCR